MLKTCAVMIELINFPNYSKSINDWYFEKRKKTALIFLINQNKVWVMSNYLGDY